MTSLLRRWKLFCACLITLLLFIDEGRSLSAHAKTYLLSQILLREEKISLQTGRPLRFSFRARSTQAQPLFLSFEHQGEPRLAGFFQAQLSPGWQSFSATFTPTASDPGAIFRAWYLGQDDDLQMDSLQFEMVGSGTILPLPSKAPTGMQMIFSEEFSTSVLSDRRWNIQASRSEGYQACCLNYGIAEYSGTALQIRDGLLHLGSSRQGENYTSGALTTEDKFSWLYGRIDISAQLPAGQGIWPAFWMLPQANEAHEIDIMEAINDEPNVYATIHAGGEQTDQCEIAIPDRATTFHTYSLLWTRERVVWLIDGEERCQTTENVPHEPMYLLINTAIGGSWPGSPDQSTSFPQVMLIDYVRIFQE